jgi:hypothetical protein
MPIGAIAAIAANEVVREATVSAIKEASINIDGIKSSGLSVLSAYSFIVLLNSTILSVDIDKPAARECPPNCVKQSAEYVSASKRLKPDILLPEPFPSFPSMEIRIDGR